MENYGFVFVFRFVWNVRSNREIIEYTSIVIEVKDNIQVTSIFLYFVSTKETCLKGLRTQLWKLYLKHGWQWESDC